jgi:hypothetical protein
LPAPETRGILYATDPSEGIMKKKDHPLDEPGQRLFWKITLTVLCAVVGALLALVYFRIL